MRKIKNNLKGFAVMDKERHIELARKGGKSAHAKGTAYKFDKETASRAGKKGAAQRAKNRTQK